MKMSPAAVQYACRISPRQDHSLLLGRRGAAEKVASSCWLGRRLRQWTYRQSRHDRQDIADYLGLTIESVSRSLSQMERDGVIGLPNIRQCASIMSRPWKISPLTPKKALREKEASSRDASLFCGRRIRNIATQTGTMHRNPTAPGKG